MSEPFSVERRVILTKTANKATGKIMKSRVLADKHGFFHSMQFENETNAWMHELTTGPEIVNAFAKEQKELHHFFMSYGSGGTVFGVGRALRKAFLGTKIHVCEPPCCNPTTYPKSGKPHTSFGGAHPIWSHVFPGWATDFIPTLASQAQKEGLIDDIISVSTNQVLATSNALAVKEGIFTGVSGGGILASALEFAETCPAGTNVLAILRALPEHSPV